MWPSQVGSQVRKTQPRPPARNITERHYTLLACCGPAEEAANVRLTIAGGKEEKVIK